MPLKGKPRSTGRLGCTSVSFAICRPFINISYDRSFVVEYYPAVVNRYFLFSDDPETARAKIALPEGRVTFVSRSRGDKLALAALRLMSQCPPLSSSTEPSVGGAWLGEGKDKIVVCPYMKLSGAIITA